MLGAWRILLLAWAAFLMFVGPARAESTTALALRALCGPGAVGLAGHVDEAGRRYLLHPVTVVGLMSVESHCRPQAVSRCGAIGLMQVLPYGPAANGRTKAQLRDPRENIATGTKWLAAMITWCGGLSTGLGAYNSGHCHRSKGFARKVLRAIARAWTGIQKRKEPRT